MSLPLVGSPSHRKIPDGAGMTKPSVVRHKSLCIKAPEKIPFIVIPEVVIGNPLSFKTKSPGFPPSRLCHNYMKRRFVILNEVKNLIGSMSSVGEILRLHLRMTLRHSIWAGMTLKETRTYAVKKRWKHYTRTLLLHLSIIHGFCHIRLGRFLHGSIVPISGTRDNILCH